MNLILFLPGQSVPLIWMLCCRHLQVGTGKFDLSNISRLGKSEVELVNTVILGVEALVDLEQQLDLGTADEATAQQALYSLEKNPPSPLDPPPPPVSHAHERQQNEEEAPSLIDDVSTPLKPEEREGAPAIEPEQMEEGGGGGGPSPQVPPPQAAGDLETEPAPAPEARA